MKIDLKTTLDRKLPYLVWDERKSRAVLNRMEGEATVKKKLSLSLVLAIAVILLAAAGIAAVSVLRVPEADAVTLARRALKQQYGLTPATMGLFYPEYEKKGEIETVRFIGDGMPHSLIGTYTVTLQNGQAKAAWSHDGADQALLNSGSLDSPAWGQKQMVTALLNDEAATEAVQRYMNAHPEALHDRPPLPTPPAGRQEDETYWQGLILKAGTPGKSDLAEDKALALAKAALLDEFDIKKEALDKAEWESSFYRPNDKRFPALWGFRLFLMKDGKVDMELGVMMNASTGEVHTIGILAGGNE